MPRLQSRLAKMEAKMKALEEREQEVKRRGLLGARVPAPGMPPPAVESAQAVTISAEAARSEEFAHMDLDGDGVVTAAELAAFTQRVQEQAQAQHQQYIAAISAVNDEAVALEGQILKVREAMGAGMARLTPQQKMKLAAKRELARGGGVGGGALASVAEAGAGQGG